MDSSNPIKEFDKEDLLLPYLFILAMEGLGGILRKDTQHPTSSITGDARRMLSYTSASWMT
jgi:hypothetical protein